ncbi:Chaoptin, partial [Eufriesea mexicana]
CLSLIISTLLNIVCTRETEWIPCVELKRDLHVPCKCSISMEYNRSLDMNCDRMVFTRSTMDNIRGQPIVSISQRNSGYQNLPEDLLNSGLNLRKLDLSGNSIHRLMGRLLRAQIQLKELRLADNLLGDNLNPIFSSNEFHGMKQLKLLDLTRNGLRSLEEGIFKGCESLEQLYLNGNNFTAVPTMSLKGPKSIRVLSLSGNNIGSLPRAAFSILGESLLRLDISENELSHIEDGAFSGLGRLLLLNISGNDLSRFNSEVFKGAYNLLQLDLSTNFLREFPSDALRHLTDLKFLNLSNNLINVIEHGHLSALSELQVLDLSRNNIGRLGFNTFLKLSELTSLDLSLNALRTIEESSFNGLVKLKWLSLQDNNILLVPAMALARLPSLAHLHMEFNRIAALPTELIEATASSLVTLALTRNLVREIPAGLFQDFQKLIRIDLSGNMLLRVARDTFVGLEETLLELDMSSNRLTSIGELPLRRLISLNLSGNRLTRISPETFNHLKKVQYLNLSSNPLYGGFPPVFPSSVIDLDVSRTDLNILPTILFRNLISLKRISVAKNQLLRIEKGTFNRLGNLSRVDLSGNRIEYIENEAFIGLTNLYQLNLRGNKLSLFTGEYFDTGTGLENLDLSSNQINRLSSTAFVIHPRLRKLDLSDNQLLYFHNDYLKSLQFLEWLNLSGNRLKCIDEFTFSQLGRLRTLNLAANRIESLNELAFHNSTQLQLLDLSENSIEVLNERTMEGLFRLKHLNLRDNRLTSLPETIFDPTRVRFIESIDLSGNRLNEIPIRSLQRQVPFLSSLNLARNRMVELFSQEITSNVKELDLSDNPLSENAIKGILGEAKILRSLNLANTGINRLAVRLEMPFLKRLNLSKNSLTELKVITLERTTMLETLDVSRNKLSDFSSVNRVFQTLPALRWLDISNNYIKIVNETSFSGLINLRFLRMSNLPNCTRIERNAFKSLGKLRSLYAYDYPKLGYFDVQGILKKMYNLEMLDIEIKDSSVSNEQLSISSHPRLKKVILRGDRLKNILSSSLVGVREPKLVFGLKNTSVDSMPTSLFFPVPRSTELELDISGSKFTTLSGQFLSALDERTGSVKIKGLRYNPIDCNCDARQLWKWLKVVDNDDPSNFILCSTPASLAGSLLTTAVSTSTTSSTFSSTFLSSSSSSSFSSGSTTIFSFSSSVKSTFLEPEIIWTVAPVVQTRDHNKHFNGDHISSSPVGSSASTDDTLIIGIVGGVVAFIAVIVIVICVCRFKWFSDRIDQTRLAVATGTSSIPDTSMIRPASAYSGKISHEFYLGSYNESTLDRRNTAIAPSIPTTSPPIMPLVQPPMHLMHTLLTPMPTQTQSQLQTQQFYGYCDGTSLPIYIACSTDIKSSDR